MKSSKVFLFVFLAGILMIFLSSHSAHASIWENQVGLGTNGAKIGDSFGVTGTPTDARIVIARAINIFLGFMGIIFVILIMLAGYKWMISSGNEEHVREAKAQMRNAVIGLVIVLMSFAISSYVMSCVFDATTGNNMWGC